MIDKKPFINELAFVNSDDIMVFEVFLAQTLAFCSEKSPLALQFF